MREKTKVALTHTHTHTERQTHSQTSQVCGGIITQRACLCIANRLISISTKRPRWFDWSLIAAGVQSCNLSDNGKRESKSGFKLTTYWRMFDLKDGERDVISNNEDNSESFYYKKWLFTTKIWILNSNLRNGKGNTGFNKSSEYIKKFEVLILGWVGYTNDSSPYVPEIPRSWHVKISNPNFK